MKRTFKTTMLNSHIKNNYSLIHTLLNTLYIYIHNHALLYHVSTVACSLYMKQSLHVKYKYILYQ